MRCQAQHHPLPLVGHGADRQAGVAALRNDGSRRLPRRPSPRRPPAACCPAAPRPAPCRGRACASPAPRRRGRLRSARSRAPTMARSSSINGGTVAAASFSGRRPCGGGHGAGAAARAMRRRRRARGTAPPRRSASSWPSAVGVAPGAHHAFGEIEPDHQADPAVGVHAVLRSRPASGMTSGSTFSASQRAARAQRRQPQLPGQAQHDEADEAAGRRPSASRERRTGGAEGRTRRGGKRSARRQAASGVKERMASIAAMNRRQLVEGSFALSVAQHRGGAGRAFPRGPRWASRPAA